MNKLLDKVFRGIDIFTGILTGAMVLFVFLNVVLRMVFNSGLTWSEELARYLFVAVTYIGAISAMRANAHMTVDMVLSKVKAPLQMTFYVISQSLIAVLMMMLVHGSYKMVLQNTAARTAALGIPYALLYSLGYSDWRLRSVCWPSPIFFMLSRILPRSPRSSRSAPRTRSCLPRLQAPAT